MLTPSSMTSHHSSLHCLIICEYSHKHINVSPHRQKAKIGLYGTLTVSAHDTFILYCVYARCEVLYDRNEEEAWN